MIKDRLLKIKVVEYFVDNFWYPQMEVNMLSKHRISNVPKLITDVDVLGMYPDISGSLHPILGDCKTLKGQSPISRSLWMKGLMDYIGSKKGLIVLSKDIEKEHQITSSLLDIQLLSEADFGLYSKATTNQSITIISALKDIECWDKLFEVDKRFPVLKTFLDFSKTQFWNESSSNYQLRSSLAILRENKGEFNPSNPLHLATVLNHFSIVAIALNNIIVTLFNRYLTPKSKEELNNDLKVFIYGGIENYEFLNNLRNRFSGNPVPEKELTLPEWDMFLELIRLVFEQPKVFSYVPIYLKEISFHFLADGDKSRFSLAPTLVRNEPQLSNYASRLSSYLCKAANLPPEFNEIYSGMLIL
ncbi:hypothetical protein [Dyadobacter pollutisoli]|uniref:Uncharacterized protein n=1 Tax=Dyadobacter pollutisoli TaxID=2910158 RepID=A0A9E8NCE7_9BACT|nr:hypothetical protein [Dyadobacter pollutisoli]WAC12411.1 hypothetical protein ON006_00320 [Dyadobacter pollutisoli]